MNQKSFGERAAWDERYRCTQRPPAEWYQGYDSPADLRPFLREHLQPADRILMAGCGNSHLSAALMADGYPLIIDADFSLPALLQLRARAHDHEDAALVRMDMRAMALRDQSIDVVIDKGTSDAVHIGSSAAFQRMVDEIYRILKPGGRYLIISCLGPENLGYELLQPSRVWRVTWRTLFTNDAYERPGDRRGHHFGGVAAKPANRAEHRDSDEYPV